MDPISNHQASAEAALIFELGEGALQPAVVQGLAAEDAVEGLRVRNGVALDDPWFFPLPCSAIVLAPALLRQQYLVKCFLGVTFPRAKERRAWLPACLHFLGTRHQRGLVGRSQ